MAIDTTIDGKYIHAFDGDFYVSLKDYEELLKKVKDQKDNEK